MPVRLVRPAPRIRPAPRAQGQPNPSFGRPAGPSGAGLATATWRSSWCTGPATTTGACPKGKVDPGETDEQAALREVQEEASVEARLGPELPTTTYLDRSGKRKQVRYWAMTLAGGEAAGAHEVDEASWVPLAEARSRLTYARDVAVLDALIGATGGASGP